MDGSVRGLGRLELGIAIDHSLHKLFLRRGDVGRHLASGSLLRDLDSEYLAASRVDIADSTDGSHNHGQRHQCDVGSSKSSLRWGVVIPVDLEIGAVNGGCRS